MSAYEVVPYRGQVLKNVLVTLKIDGVLAIRKYGLSRDEDSVVSKAGKPLYNIKLPLGVEVAEVYVGSWESTISAVRTKSSGTPVKVDNVYPLYPHVDNRLVLAKIPLLNQAIADQWLEDVVTLSGNKAEGVVFHATDSCKRYKHKVKETYDVPVTGYTLGKGKHVGKIGAILTPMGKVGTGLSDELRFSPPAVGTIIEVECMELTNSGKFRHPRFVRVREDKK